jgi:hypothetical protein
MKLSSYLTEDTSCLHYKDQPVNVVQGTMAVHSQIHVETVSVLCGHNTVFLMLKQVIT